MKIKCMDSFLYWYSQNNKIIIQFLCVGIGLFFIYFIYRTFFSSSEASGDEAQAQATSKQIADLDKKISKLIDRNQGAPVAVFTGEASEYEANAKADVAVEAQAKIEAVFPGDAATTNQTAMTQIQNEVAQLKKELQSSSEMLTAKNEELNAVKEKMIESQKALSAEPGMTAVSTSADEAALIAKIDELQKKLQEYDIISDDIAEIQTLRAENAELKLKVEEKASAG